MLQWAIRIQAPKAGQTSYGEGSETRWGWVVIENENHLSIDCLRYSPSVGEIRQVVTKTMHSFTTDYVILVRVCITGRVGNSPGPDTIRIDRLRSLS
jgi:hypothetical protein